MPPSRPRVFMLIADGTDWSSKPESAGQKVNYEKMLYKIDWSNLYIAFQNMLYIQHLTVWRCRALKITVFGSSGGGLTPNMDDHLMPISQTRNRLQEPFGWVCHRVCGWVFYSRCKKYNAAAERSNHTLTSFYLRHCRDSIMMPQLSANHSLSHHSS